MSELAATARTELGWSDNEESRAFARFRDRYPDYAGTARLDELREREYARLDAQGQTYLDFTGGGLYAESQLVAHMAVLRESVLGNPHSVNPASLTATELVQGGARGRAALLQRVAGRVHRDLHAQCDRGLKLVAEAYPFEPGRRLLLTADNHNSVNGLREYARAAGATTTYVPSLTPSLRVDDRASCSATRPGSAACSSARARSRSCSGRGSRAGRSSRPSRATGTSPHPTARGSRTGP